MSLIVEAVHGLATLIIVRSRIQQPSSASIQIHLPVLTIPRPTKGTFEAVESTLIEESRLNSSITEIIAEYATGVKLPFREPSMQYLEASPANVYWRRLPHPQCTAP